MTAVHRTSPANFAAIDFVRAWPDRIVEWDAPDVDVPLELHVTDAPAVGEERGTFLLLHGEPSWSLLYERWIPRLTAAGYRCVAPDLAGFGRSDKPTDDAWYSYERHCAAVRHIIGTLELDRIHLVVQDWAGPIGLRQLVDDPDRFARTFIFNTWLHRDDFPYSDGVRWWREAAINGDALGGDMPTGRIVAGTMRRVHPDPAAVEAAFDAPFDGYDSKAGARAFPAMIPFGAPEVGGAVEQARCDAALVAWTGCPIHIAFGDGDPVFPYEQAEAWAARIPGATLDRIEQAGHFVQYDAPDDCLTIIGRRLDLAI
jgi:haloalkane dehalogenase